MTGRVLLAVDGGNSKTDVVLLGSDGSVLAAVRGPTVSHQAVGPMVAGERLAALVRHAEAAAGVPRGSAALGVLCLAGVDSRADERLLAATHGAGGLAGELRLRNDAVAALRAGSPHPWGVAVILGAGINAVGITRTGREVRFAGLGAISGDRGGGEWLGTEGLGAAVRARDGRGPRTTLEDLVPAALGLRRPIDVTLALYHGRLAMDRLGELAPVVVGAARDGDPVALSLLGALADEAASFAIAAIRRGGLVRAVVPVVLAGGVARGAGPLLRDLVVERVRRVARQADVSVLREPPVLGAALLALDEAAPGDEAAAARAVAGIAHASFEAG